MSNKVLTIAILFALSVVNAQSQVKPTKCDSNETSYNLPCTKQQIDLVNSKITIKIYTKNNPKFKIDRTFVVVHADEKQGLDAAKKVISDNYGRLVEIVSNARSDENKRYLYFGENNLNCVDPNRIYTENGIIRTLANKANPCVTVDNASAELIKNIKLFADDFLKIVTNNNTHNFIIGVHNNDSGGLSLENWSYDKNCGTDLVKKVCEDAETAVGIFKANNHSVEKTVVADDFILVSNPTLFVKIINLETSFNIALQENRSFLVESTTENKIKPRFDDGSMSIYFGTKLTVNTKKPFNYVNIEAMGKDNPTQPDENKNRQMKAIKLVIKIQL